MQRYAHTWSGDNTSTWDTLRYNVPMGLGLSLCGSPHVGHDVGGFAGRAPSPELFVRWVQNGVLHPRFTIHSWHDDGTVNEPWMYPEVLPLVRDAIEFRYRLLPYLYSLVFEAARTGHPIIRPMVYAFGNDVRTHTESFDFMLGPHLLVASVLEEGARQRSVYLPAGRRWYCFHTGRMFDGGQEVTVEAPLDRIPLFVPEGGIVPMGKVMRYVGEGVDDAREVRVFPGTGSFVLIEDDGLTEGGPCTRVTLSVEDLVVTAVAEGDYPLAYTHVDCVLPGGHTRRVEVGWLGRRSTSHEA
jgi:alpha-glucosidase